MKHYKILALKYRPQDFKDLIGQEVLSKTITNAIKVGKTPNAYLLTGIKTGQMFYRLAFFFPYMLASVINCQIWKYLFHPIHGLGGYFSSIGIDFLASSPFTTKVQRKKKI